MLSEIAVCRGTLANWIIRPAQLHYSRLYEALCRTLLAQQLIPVLSIIPFEDEEDAVAIANDVRFGLGAGVWTSDMGRAFRPRLSRAKGAAHYDDQDHTIAITLLIAIALSIG